MPLLGGIAGFVDKYLLGYALGTAAGPALEPYAQSLANAGWQANQVMPPEYVLLAKGVAEGKIAHDWAAARAAEQGISGGAFDRLVAAAKAGPGTSLAFRLWRRGYIGPAEFDAALRDDGVRDEWIAELRNLKEERLSPADVANAVQQGFVPNAGLLAGDTGGSPPYTPAVEEVPIDTLAEFEASGVPSGRARVLAQLVGLPPGVFELLRMWRRGIITETAVDHGIREGHIKTKWTSALKELRYEVLSARDAAELWLRGWIDQDEANRIGALSGYRPEDVHRLYLNRGRPATPHQIHIGYARGGRYLGENLTEREAFERAVRNSNIRTEYTDVLWAARYTYPTVFVVRALTQDGTFDRDTTEQILVEIGWKPEWSALAADKWSGSGAGPSTKWADRARSRLFTAAHDDYLDGNASDADARALLGNIGASAVEVDAVLRLWEIERARTRRDLTQAQILKLWHKAIWPHDQALEALLDQGMRPEDAENLLLANAP